MADTSYKKRYVIRQSGDKGMNFIATIPPKLIQQKAQQAGLSVEDFISSYDLICVYSFEASMFTYCFIKREVSDGAKDCKMLAESNGSVDIHTDDDTQL
jgi:hypothetical protein